MSIDFVKLFSERTIWKMSPGRGGKWWKKYFRKGDYIGLGVPYDWDTDLSSLRIIDEIPPEIIGPRRQEYYWQFAKEMKKGDIVIVVGAGKIFGVCEVIGDYRHYDTDLPHRRKVRWIAILEISNKDGKICKAVYNIQTTLVPIDKIDKAQELRECGERLNSLIESSDILSPDFSGSTVSEVLTAEVQSSIDLDFLEDIHEDILTSKDSEIVERVIRRYRRDQRVVDALKALYGGCCQFKGCTNMIETETGWYTEAHHLIPLEKGGSDQPTNLVNLCPQHHKMLHHAKNREELTDQLNFWYHSKHRNLF